jgi:hypothetical protein
MELQEAWRDVIRPTMRREPKTPGNKGVQVVMVDLNGDGIPDPPEPEREPIAVVESTAWKAGNNYTKDQTVYFNTASFSGGAEGTVYRYRMQKRADADAGWSNFSWKNYSGEVIEINNTCPEGQMRMQCQARDDSVDPVDQVNSFTSIQTVTTPTMLPIEITADGAAYDPATETLEGSAGDSLLLGAVPAADGLVPLTYSWTVRSGSARLTPTKGSCVVILQSAETELVSVQVDINDSSLACADTPQSVRFGIMARP